MPRFCPQFSIRVSPFTTVSVRGLGLVWICLAIALWNYILFVPFHTLWAPLIFDFFWLGVLAVKLPALKRWNKKTVSRRRLEREDGDEGGGLAGVGASRGPKGPSDGSDDEAWPSE